MKNVFFVSLFVLAVGLLASCTQNLDPLSPGNMDGQYALGVKALVPLAIGNTWTYHVMLYDTTGVVKTSYNYTLSVIDTVKADTSKIPLSSKDKGGRRWEAWRWYVVQGEMGARAYWQIDTLEQLRIRKAQSDTLFLQQMAFDFRADVGAVTPVRFIDADTVTWASGDIVVTSGDSVKSKLVAKTDTLRTTLGSAPYFKYWQSFSIRTDSVNYYFKPGFGLVFYEKFQRKSDGTKVCVRRDELASYYFR